MDGYSVDVLPDIMSSRSGELVAGAFVHRHRLWLQTLDRGVGPSRSHLDTEDEICAEPVDPSRFVVVRERRSGLVLKDDGGDVDGGRVEFG